MVSTHSTRRLQLKSSIEAGKMFTYDLLKGLISISIKVQLHELHDLCLLGQKRRKKFAHETTFFLGIWRILTDEWHQQSLIKLEQYARKTYNQHLSLFLLQQLSDFSSIFTLDKNETGVHIGLSGLRSGALRCINDTNIAAIILFHLPSCRVARALCLPSLFISRWQRVCPRLLTLAVSLICNAIWTATPVFRVIFMNCQIIPVLKLAVGCD